MEYPKVSIRRSLRVESVYRALVLLKMIINEGDISVSEAADYLDVHPSTASRLLATLAQQEFASQGSNLRYGPGAYTSNSMISENRNSVQILLRPYLEDLYQRTQETVHLASLTGVYVHHYDFIEATHHTLVFTNRLGTKTPAQLSSTGKSMLADLLPAVVDSRYAAAREWNKIAAHNLVRLHSELDRVRQHGYATNFEETERGLAAISVSLGHIDGEHVAMNVCLPLARYNQVSAARIKTSLFTIKYAVERDLSLDKGRNTAQQYS